jgi:hypothetical protein
MMDLSKFNLEAYAEKGADMELLDPIENEVLTQDNGDAVTIKLLGTDSKAYKNKNKSYQRARIAKMAKSRSKAVDYTVSDKDACDMLAACTVGWSGIVVDKEVIEFSEGAAQDLYMNYDWIREQVDAFVGDRANFFPSA